MRFLVSEVPLYVCAVCEPNNRKRVAAACIRYEISRAEKLLVPRRYSEKGVAERRRGLEIRTASPEYTETELQR